VTAVVERFRHRGRRELDLRAPRWDEDREWVSALLEDAPAVDEVAARRTFEEARAAALAALPRRKHRTFLRKLERVRTFVWLREEMRDLSSRMYYLIRRHGLEIAAGRGIGDDIFFMSFAEILADDRSGVARNREIYESYRNFKAPNEIGSRFEFSAQPPAGALSGIGASRGVARGVAHVARSVEEALGAGRGAILVCPFTDPGWTPVLGRVAGVVTETGGLLSHAAVICREYGIPAVLGVPAATDRIPHGSRIAVHGQEGFAELLDRNVP
jgi:pyruvate,water dikinase